MTLTISFYQDGIARVVIDEVKGVEKRFRISDEKDFAVMESQLISTEIQTHITDQSVEISGIASEDGEDVFTYELTFKPMRLVQRVNGMKTLTLFASDSLYFEKTTGVNADVCLAMDPISFA